MKDKKLLVLGGTTASLDVVKIAKRLGAYVIIADAEPPECGAAKPFADECRRISTTDTDGLLALISAEHIDGVFCGPGEFNIRNVIALCERAGLPCYTGAELWERCADKLSFKRYCMKNGLDVPRLICERRGNSPEFYVKREDIEYPVIVKPSAGSSSKGITVCRSEGELWGAFEKAGKVGGSVYAEEYIDNGGRLFSVRYLAADGEYYPYLMLDTYIADPIEKKRLISALSVYPSVLAAEYMKKYDAKMRRMLRDIGIKNGTAFIQCIPKDGKLYVMEMGYRLSGGMMYKLTERLCGINDMEMMIRYALGGKLCTTEDIERTRHPRKLAFAQLTAPLECGRIGEISGLDKVQALPEVIDILQYYRVGDVITPDVIGTLGQHFARFTLMSDTREAVLAATEKLRSYLRVTDTEGREMLSAVHLDIKC